MVEEDDDDEGVFGEITGEERERREESSEASSIEAFNHPLMMGGKEGSGEKKE